MCRLCRGSGVIHRGDCPRYVGAGACRCTPQDCFLCRADRDRIRTWGLILLGLALAAVIWGLMK